MSELIDLDVSEPIWEHFFSVYPLVLVGTREADGADDLAPKHLAMPLSWQNDFGFVCSPRHRTYQNILRTRQFAVSYARPSQAVLASLAATPRCEDGSKPITAALPVMPARNIDAPLLEEAYLYLECELTRIYDDFGVNSLIAGRIVAARVAEDAMRESDLDDLDLVHHSPLLAYLYPGRFTSIDRSQQLPFPKDFRR